MGVSRQALLLGIASLFLRGGAAQAAAHLTLQEVAQKVVLTNPEVLSKWHAFKSAAGEVDMARAAFYPKLDYTTGLGRETLRQPGVADREYSRNGYTLTLNQMLYDGFATASDVRRLDKARLTRYFELLDAAENAALEAGRAYYDVMRYRLLMYLAENNYIEHRASYEQLLRRAQAGAGRRVDVEHAASRLALAELNLNTEAANLHDVMARFQRLVGEPPPAVLFGPAGLAADYPVSEADSLRLALRQNPALRAAVENVESAQHDIELRRSAFHPKLDLRMRNESIGNYQGVTGTRQNNVAEVVLSYNLFNGGADMARQRVYAERKNLAMDLREKSCRDLRQTLSIAYNDVVRLRAQLSNLDLQVGSIEKTRDAYKAQFNIGQRSLLDLLDTENELLNARRTAVNADMDLALAYLRTQAGIGRLLEFLGLKRIDEQDKPQPDELAAIVESEICPPQAAGSYLVDLEALTARAMMLMEASRPAADTAPATLPGPSSSAPPPAPAPTPRPAAATAAAKLPAPSASGTVAMPAPSSAEMPPLAPAGADPLPGAKSVQPRQAQRELLAERVKAWAAAWSAQAFTAYADFYAPSFVPADGSSRDGWAKQRQQRLSRPAQVAVEIRNFRLKDVANDVAIAEFEQHYRSDSYSDRTRKVLKWVRLGGQWLIQQETARPLAASAASRRKAEK
ncbi:MAG: TolC family outer membrane protein [Rhodocyclales bacterium]|nr:TolC family outer membrane protein [Rhodocyclales bacterium]